jgi:hypothetical protein
MDFSITLYLELIEALQKRAYIFQPFEKFLRNPAEYSVILRHDVDARKLNSLKFAQIQNAKGIQGTYYFRIVPQSFNKEIIFQIADLGHEIGYHYETLDTCRGNVEKAWDEFRINLDTFRKIVPVNTICMHGSPRSRYDNRDLWKKYDYKSVGLIGEPYFDIDFNKVAYLTDTGRQWDGDKVSIRDKVNSDFHMKFHSTKEIINHAHLLPEQVMFTFHPQRWTNNIFSWTQELIMQNTKNIIKQYYLK